MVALERTIERANRACDLDFHIRQQVSTYYQFQFIDSVVAVLNHTLYFNMRFYEKPLYFLSSKRMSTIKSLKLVRSNILRQPNFSKGLTKLAIILDYKHLWIFA